MKKALSALAYQLSWALTGYLLIPLELKYSAPAILVQHACLIFLATGLLTWCGANRLTYIYMITFGLIIEYVIWFAQLEALYTDLPDEFLDWLIIAFLRTSWNVVIFGIIHLLLKLINKAKHSKTNF